MKKTFQAFSMVVVCTLLTACGPSNKEIMQSWVGMHRDDLMRSWGPPTQEVPLSTGGMLLSYTRGRGQVYAPAGNMVVGVPRSCRADFETDASGKITNWRYEGHC